MSVLVCRGCCCGTASKHPGVDHDGHVDRLRTSVEGVAGARLFTVDCLDLCTHSNVVVVRARGQRRWFGEMLDDSIVATLGEWLMDGGTAPLPSNLAMHAFDPEATPTPKAVMDTRHGAELAMWIAEMMRGGGVWTTPAPDATPVSLSPGAEDVIVGEQVVGSGPSGTFALRVTDDLRAFVFDRSDEPGVSALIVFACVGAAPQSELPLGLELPKGFVAVAIHSPFSR
ncbi:MAG: hypothetical protein JWL72_2854 [Ilumatobacteraceae bacterium]|nr:hypothetical protein [Ilumatobacteraceae bacterium]